MRFPFQGKHKRNASAETYSPRFAEWQANNSTASPDSNNSNNPRLGHPLYTGPGPFNQQQRPMPLTLQPLYPQPVPHWQYANPTADPTAMEAADYEAARRASLQVYEATEAQRRRDAEWHKKCEDDKRQRDAARRAAQEAKEAAYRLSHKYCASGSLEYSEPLVDGFYMPTGDYPELEDVLKERGSRFPTLDDLRRVSLLEGDVREVVFVDADQDSGLVAIQEKAAAATADAVARSSEDGRDLASKRIKALAEVVVSVLGGAFDSEDTLQQIWQAESAKQKEKNGCIVIHLAQLPAGTCRHRALLFKVLADSLNLMCQLQRSRHSECEPERVVNVVQIDKKDYVVDLVFEPGKLEPVQQFAARNPAFAHLRAGNQPSTRYPNPVPPLPSPHPPQQIARPSSSTATVSPAPPTQAAVAPAATVPPTAPLAPPDMSSLVLRTKSEPSEGIPGVPSANGLAPASNGPTRPSSGTNVNVGMPATMPTTPLMAPSMPATPPPGVPHTAGGYHNNLPGSRHVRAGSWEELTRRHMNPAGNNFASDEGAGNGSNWVTFNHSFGRGSHLGAMLNAAAQHRGNPPPMQGSPPPGGGPGSPFANHYHMAMMYTGGQPGAHDAASHIGQLRGHNSDGVPTSHTHFYGSGPPMPAPMPLHNAPLQNGPTNPLAPTGMAPPPAVPLQPGARPLLSNAYHPLGSSSMQSERSSSSSSQQPPTALQSPPPISAAAAAFPFSPPVNPAGLVHAHTVNQPSPPQHSPHPPPHHSQSTPALMGQVNGGASPSAEAQRAQVHQALMQQQQQQLQAFAPPNGLLTPAVGSAPSTGGYMLPKAGIPPARAGQLPPPTPPLHPNPLMNGFTMGTGSNPPPRPPGMFTSPPQPPKPPSQPTLNNPSPTHTSPMPAGVSRGLGPLNLAPAHPGFTHTAMIAKQQQREGDKLFSELSPFDPRPQPPPPPRLGSSASTEKLSAMRAQGAASPGASSQTSQPAVSKAPSSPFTNPQAATAAAAAAMGSSPAAASAAPAALGQPMHSPTHQSLSGRSSGNSSSSNLQGSAYDQPEGEPHHIPQPVQPKKMTPTSAPPISPLLPVDSGGADANQPLTQSISDLDKSLMNASAVAGDSGGGGGASQQPALPLNGLSPLTSMPSQVVRYPIIGAEKGHGLQGPQGFAAPLIPTPANIPAHEMLFAGVPPNFMPPTPANPVYQQPPPNPHNASNSPFAFMGAPRVPPPNPRPLPQPIQSRPPQPQPSPVGADQTGLPNGSGVYDAPAPDYKKQDETFRIAFGMWEINPADLDYQNGQRLGTGSYGEVYKGTWLGTDVAIKRFLDQNVSEKIRQEFKNEVKLMSHLRHPNIVLFMGAVVQPTELAIVSEFVPRGSLYRLLHRTHARIEPRRLLLMALDIARGMQYLHSKMVVHRDLKSPNLLVDMDFSIKIADFGLSRVANATNTQTPRSSCAGTPEWMAPEILRNLPADEKSDVFSFGVILWELVTRKEPWGGLNPMQVVGAVGFGQQRLAIPSDLDPELARMIQACFQEQPHLRPSFRAIVEKLGSMQVLLPSPSCMAAREAEMRQSLR